MIRAFATLIVALLPLAAWADRVDVRIDLSDQEMTVSLDDQPLYHWPVSTARTGKCTPTGTYGVQSMKRMHYSTLYHNAPMPWSIFFKGNYAIHGTTQIDRLGAPASAGCVRLTPENAKVLFDMVLENGRANTIIRIED
ncbi:MAG: L,D-transpeptidase [Roseovarius sp.]|jgi:lipoprotein-anchoring transpeptidase ErfK/SrfK|nr:L,D-transpeptidase [Roseovarius sp.]